MSFIVNAIHCELTLSAIEKLMLNGVHQLMAERRLCAHAERHLH